MRIIGLVANKDKKAAFELIPQIINSLEAKQARLMLESETAVLAGRSDLAASWADISQNCQGIIVLGGDGTVLNTARTVIQVPLLGVNLGRVGFLSEVDIPELESSLQKLINDEYVLEERMMLFSQVVRQGQVLDNSIALNDAVITKGAFSRMIRLKAEVDKETIAVYPVDGLIVSSPTGSTAYSLSSGGPVVVPDMDLMILTPICPHTLWARPVVMPASRQLKITVLSDNAEIMLTMDGQYAYRLEPGDEVLITRASCSAKFIKLSGRSFYSVLHSKLSEGDLKIDETSS